MRGRTLANAYVVLDEAQNATTMQMKMFLTRLGEGSRMAVTGDITQIDLPRGVKSGLVEAERILRDVPGIGFTRFTAEDVVRHPLVARIIRAYESAPPGRCLKSSRRSSRTRAGSARGGGSRRSPSGRRGRRSPAVGRDPELHEIGLLACDDARIAALNADFRGKALPTNVLSLAGLRRAGAGGAAGAAGGGAALPRRHRARLRDLRPRGGGGGHPAADHAAHLVVHGTLHLLGHDHAERRRGRGDGGDRDECPCQHGHREPIFARGAPLGRGVRTGVMGEQTDGPAASAPRAPDEDPDSSSRSSSSRGCSAAIPPKTTTSRADVRATAACRGARPAG